LAKTQLFAVASLILMLLAKLKPAVLYVPAYHKLFDETKLYEDFLHHDLAITML